MQYKKKFINDKILESGRVEYLDKGFRAGNISTIANNAGVPVGNLYRYFDGKAGLLDAIVKPAYTEIPKIISKLAQDYAISDGDNFDALSNALVQVFLEYGKEIVILADKCATTRYDNFAENTINLVYELVKARLYPNASEADRLMALLISKSVVNSLFDVLRMELSVESTTEAILRLMRFHFSDAHSRK